MLDRERKLARGVTSSSTDGATRPSAAAEHPGRPFVAVTASPPHLARGCSAEPGGVEFAVATRMQLGDQFGADCRERAGQRYFRPPLRPADRTAGATAALGDGRLPFVSIATTPPHPAHRTGAKRGEVHVGVARRVELREQLWAHRLQGTLLHRVPPHARACPDRIDRTALRASRMASAHRLARAGGLMLSPAEHQVDRREIEPSAAARTRPSRRTRRLINQPARPPCSPQHATYTPLRWARADKDARAAWPPAAGTAEPDDGRASRGCRRGRQSTRHRSEGRLRPANRPGRDGKARSRT